MDRIRKETTPTREQTYTYDERGNRQSILIAKSPTIADGSYTYDALNRLKTYAKMGKKSPIRTIRVSLEQVKKQKAKQLTVSI
nr:hypothetical protein [Brevibacillus laterosporus]